VTRAAAVVFLIGAVALAGPVAVLVDGREVDILRLAQADGRQARFERADGAWAVPTNTLVSAGDQTDPSPDETAVFNLYLANGDRLHGTVAGTGEVVTLSHESIRGLAVPLDRVRAVCFGRLLQGLQAKYSEVFRAELARGRDVVVVQRDTRPFPIHARVLAIGEKALDVLVGERRRSLPLHKVYGFVRAVDARDGIEAKGILVRLRLQGNAHVTLPLDRITADAVLSGDAVIERKLVRRIEFAGGHIAHLSDFDPIDVKEVALFGKAPRWRRDAMVFGGPLRLSGRTYARGLGVHAHSRLEFVLGARWRYLFVRCGIDDSAGAEGRAIFRLYGDGKLLKEIGVHRGGPDEPVLLDVKGVDRLVLEAAPGDSYTSDFCNWAEARVFNADPADVPRKK